MEVTLGNCGAFEWESIEGETEVEDRLVFTCQSCTVVGHLVYVVGGETEQDVNNKLWVIDLIERRWVLVKDTVPDGVWRKHHAAVLVDEYIYLYGGKGRNDPVLSDLWRLDVTMSDFLKCHQSGPRPPLIEDFSVSYMQSSDTMVLFGGELPSLKSYTNQLFMLKVSSLEWYVPKIVGRLPDPRCAHATCAGFNELYLFGGYGEKGNMNDLHMLTHVSINKYVWSQPATGEYMPVPRHRTSICVFGKRLCVFGGYSREEVSNKLDIYDMDTEEWRLVKQVTRDSAGEQREDFEVIGELPPNACHGVTSYENGMLVLGGAARANRLYWILSPASP